MAVFERVANSSGSCIDPSRAYLNYLFAVLLTFLFIISTLLNPLIFVYQRSQKPSLASILFQVTMN